MSDTGSGRSPADAGSGHSAEPEPVPVSALRASVLNAVPPVVIKLWALDAYAGLTATETTDEAADTIIALMEALESARESLRMIRDDRSRISAAHRAEVALVVVNAAISRARGAA